MTRRHERDRPRADELVDEQIEYYRARAPWYDDWWESRGSYDRSEPVRERWIQERSALEEDLDDWAQAHASAHVLELAAGTGNLTRIVARHAERVTAIDASPEVLARNRAKLGTAAARVDFRVRDLFAWEPERTWDAALFGFWISHVPTGRWAPFWDAVRAALPVGAHVWFCDNAAPELAWEAGVVDRPGGAPDRLTGDGTIDRTTDVHERSLPDGRSFRLVKRFHEPDVLAADLDGRGFDADVRTTEWAFLLGRAVRR